MEQKDPLTQKFSLICLSFAVLFAAVGVLACLSSIGLGWKVPIAFATGGAALLYAFIAWKCRP